VPTKDLAMRVRPYSGLEDLVEMKHLVSEILSRKPHSIFHPGDLDWRLFSVSAGYVPQEIIQLWENDSGNLSAFLFLYPGPGFLDLVVTPDLSGGDQETEILNNAAQYVLASDLCLR
jgi:hypothetical protein